MSLAFNPKSIVVTWNFENPVYEVQSFGSPVTCEPQPSTRCAPATSPKFLLLGNSVTFGMGYEEILYGGGSLISRPYSLTNSSNTFSSDTGLDFGFNLAFQAGCYDVSVPGFDTNKCGYSTTFHFADRPIPLFSNSFALGGFNTASFLTPVMIDYDSSGNPLPVLQPETGSVPEPSSILLIIAIAIALLGMGIAKTRKGQM